MEDTFLNPELIALARQSWPTLKEGFVPAQDAAQPPGGGPPPGAGAPQQDPSQMGGGDPSGGMGGGAPPPAAGAVSGGDEQMASLMQRIQMLEMAGGGGAGGKGLQPKIDVNSEIMIIKNILAKIADALGIPIPAQDMVATGPKLQQMAMGQQPVTPAGTGQQGAVQPVQPMGGMQPAFDQPKQASLRPFDVNRFTTNSQRAQAIKAALLKRR